MTPICVSESAKPTTSLDHGGSNVDGHVKMSPAQVRFWAHTLPEKQLLNEAVRLHEPDRRRRRKILHCSEHILISHNFVTDAVRAVSNGCEHRLCPRCGKARALQVALRTEKWIGRVNPNQWRFITLTIRSKEGELADQLTHLQESFRRLRQTKVWQATQGAGKGFIEVTYNGETKQWHPHLHVIVKGRFLAQSRLSHAWKLSSGGSKIVDIRAVNSASNAAKYVSKYLGKTPPLIRQKNAVALTAEYYLAIRDRKMILSFGKAGPLPELDYDDDPSGNAGNWHVVCSLSDAMKFAESGSHFHRWLLSKLENPNHRGNAPPKGKGS